MSSSSFRSHPPFGAAIWNSDVNAGRYYGARQSKRVKIDKQAKNFVGRYGDPRRRATPIARKEAPSGPERIMVG
jgi:hypothetical protein